MKIEIEIPDEEIRKYVQEQAKGIIKCRPESLRRLLEKKVEKHMFSLDWEDRVASAVKHKADLELERAVNQKVPGWVRRKIKEMLRYCEVRSEVDDYRGG